MKLNNLKPIVIHFFKKISGILKDIKTLPNVWLYIVLAIVLTFIFLIITFPYGVIVRNELQKIGENIGKSAYVGKIDFGLIRSTKIDTMTIVFRDGAELALQNINLDINAITAYLTNSVKGSLRIENIRYRKDKTSVTLVAGSEFDLEFSSFSEIPVDGSIKLDLQNVIANGLNVSEFDIPPVRFTSVAAGLNLQKKKLSIDECRISGPDIKGSISGSIVLGKFFQQSQLNLSIVVDSASSFMTNYKLFLGKWMDVAGNLRIQIKGSVSNPNIDNPSGRKADNTPVPAAETVEQKPNINKRPRFNASPRPRVDQPEPVSPSQPSDEDTYGSKPFIPEGID